MMMSKQYLYDWLEKHLLMLNIESNSINYEEGYTRLGYSKEESNSMDVFETIAKEIHMTVTTDQAGNRIARWNGTKDIPAMALGSHIDTVIHGGAYDGVSGLLCALAAIHQLQKDLFVPVRPIEVICFASEESSRFGISTIGSEAMTGLIDKDAIAHLQDKEGMTIQETLDSAGYNWNRLHEAERSEDAIYKFLELHIEQGNRIEQSGKQFGVVTAIARPFRYKIAYTGQSNHSGTTLMDERKDALVAAANLISFIYDRANDLSKSEMHPIVATVGTVNILPNGMTSVPGFVELGIDIRSVNDSLKERLGKEILLQLTLIEDTYHVKTKVKKDR